MKQRSQQGFSLIEALVAMVIIAVLATALLRMVAGSVATGGDMEERTLAVIIASNRLVDLQQGGAWPDGTLSSETEMAGRTWQVEAKAMATDSEAMKRMEIRVWKAGANTPGEPTLIGFVEKPDAP